MFDAYKDRADEVSAPARRAAAVVPNDAAMLAELPRALFVGTGGTLVLRGAGDAADTVFRNVPSGSVLPFRAAAVRASGTDAADIVALY